MYLTLFVLLLLLCNTYVAGDQRKSTPDLIRSYGFNVAIYEIISQNYTLKAYRIINPLANQSALNPVPVVCHHGIGIDAANMLASGKNARPRKPNPFERVTLFRNENGTNDRNLQFYLSNNNYDVWMLDARGVDYEKRAEGGNQKKYWDFSIDEQALFDLPNQINFVLEKTGKKKVAYIGFSQTTTFMFALLSADPDFSEKLVTYIALAPVVFTDHVKGFFNLQFLIRLFRVNVATPYFSKGGTDLVNLLSTYMCAPSIIKDTLCKGWWRILAGFDVDSDYDNSVTESFFKGFSIKTLEQFIENSLTRDFRMFDYKDEQRNMEEYGQPLAPKYNLDLVNLKTIVLFRGTKDTLSDPQDQMKLLVRLKVPIYEDHILVDYAHLDFIISKTVVEDINEPICKILDRLSNRPLKSISHSIIDQTKKISPQVEREVWLNMTRRNVVTLSGNMIKVD